MDHLAALLQQILAPRILVLGDAMVDCYTSGDADRISPEAPIPVLRVQDRQARLGGAGCVASLARGLGAEVVLAGTVGDDSAGRLVMQLAEEIYIDAQMVMIVCDRPTTTKHRFIGRAAGRHAHQMLRVDEESREPLSEQQQQRLVASVADHLPNVDALLISDYGKGVCTPWLLGRIIAIARRHDVPVIVDPASGADYEWYRDATVLTPNRSEAALATAGSIQSPDDGLTAALQLCQRLSIDAVTVTLDRDGIALADRHHFTQHFSCRPRDVYDITGAGDTVVAVIGLCQAAGLPLFESVQLANFAAGLQVERFGASVITRDGILAEIRCTESTPARLRSEGQSRVADVQWRMDYSASKKVDNTGHVTGMAASLQKVVFLDRDGTINVDHGYVHRLEDWEFADQAPQSIKLLRDAGYSVAIVTNQAGIAESLYTVDDVQRLHEFMNSELAMAGTSVDAIAFCPHRRDQACACRKPATGMAAQIERQLGNRIDYQASWTIGDKVTDTEFGVQLGTRTALLRSRYWNASELRMCPDIIADTLHGAVLEILRRHESKIASPARLNG